MARVLHGCARTTPSSSRVPSVAREHPVACCPIRPELQDGEEMALPDHDGRWANGPQGTLFLSAYRTMCIARCPTSEAFSKHSEGAVRSLN